MSLLVYLGIGIILAMIDAVLSGPYTRVRTIVVDALLIVFCWPLLALGFLVVCVALGLVQAMIWIMREM